MVRRASLLAILIGSTVASTGAAQGQATGTDASSLARAAQNPLAALVTLPLQANDRTTGGREAQVRFQINFMFPTGP